MNILRRWIKQTKGIGIAAVSIMLVLALVASACAPAGAAATEKVVKIGNMVGLTGALATTLGPAAYGQFDCTRWVNEHGGVNGVKIEHLWENTQGLVPKCITAFKRLKAAGVVAVFEISSAPMEAMLATYQREKTPCLSINAHTPRTLSKPPWIIAGLNSWACAPATFMTWVKENWAEARPPKFGVIFYDHASGWDALEGARWAAEREYGELVGYEVVPLLGAIDTSVEWLRLAGKNPDWIYVSAYGATLTTLVKDAARLEIQKKGIKLCSTPLGFTENYLDIVGLKVAEGWHRIDAYMLVRQPEPEEMTPEFENLCEAARNYRGREPEDNTSQYVVGWIYGAIMTEGIRKAIEKVGFDNLSPEAVREGIVSIREFNTGLTLPITITDEKPHVLDYLKFYQFREGKSVAVSDYIKTISIYY